MIFRELNRGKCKTYLIGSEREHVAVLVDPVREKLDRYLALLAYYGLKLDAAIDTHTHADHRTAVFDLKELTGANVIMHRKAPAPQVNVHVDDGDSIALGDLSIKVLYTPGHTPDGMSLHIEGRVLTGDTLLIRGTGRTDFQNGDPRQQYESIFGRLLNLPDATLVYPGHDYKGDTVSTIGEERAYNPRLQVKSVDEYVDLMNNLKLPNPKMMDVAVPANMKVGLAQEEIARRGWMLSAGQALALLGKPDIALIDLRERSERERHGTIPGSLHVPYPTLQESIRSGGMLHELAKSTSKRLLFYCAFGERSAMAVQAAQDAGLATACHIGGGLDAWKKASGPLVR